MKNNFLLVMFLSLPAFSLSGQEQTAITVKAGTKVLDYFTFNERYRYPEFIQGKVVFKNGNFTITKLNYSILYGEMHFIQAKDTLAVGNAKNIRYVQIMQDTFYWDNGYLEVLAGHDPANMCVKHFIKLSDVLKEGAYGTRTSTGSVQTYGSVYDAGGRANYELILQEDMVFTRIKDYYIGNTRDGFLAYKQNNVLKLLPQYKSAIEEFLKTNDISFKSREDLIKLTDFIHGIR
jgi:hypothetical protein